MFTNLEYNPLQDSGREPKLVLPACPADQDRKNEISRRYQA